MGLMISVLRAELCVERIAGTYTVYPALSLLTSGTFTMIVLATHTDEASLLFLPIQWV